MASDLIARLEAAPCGSRELDIEILTLFGYRDVHGDGVLWDRGNDGYWTMDGDENTRPLPSPSCSVDDALALAKDDIDALAALQEALQPTLPSAALRKALACRVCAAILRAREASEAP